MPQGLQVFDSNGNLTLDTSTQTMRLLDILSISQKVNPTGSITYPIDPTKTQIQLIKDVLLGEATYASPVFKVSGSTVSWSYPNPYKLDFFVSAYVLVVGV